MVCDLCGKDQENLVKVLVESVEMDVCDDCKNYGEQIQTQNFNPIKNQIRETEKESIVENFSSIIKKTRESLDLKQAELAKRINEKESIIHKLENNSLQPTISLAKKLEKELNIKLIAFESLEYENNLNEDEALTIGDLIKKNDNKKTTSNKTF